MDSAFGGLIGMAIAWGVKRGVTRMRLVKERVLTRQLPQKFPIRPSKALSKHFPFISTPYSFVRLLPS